MVPELKSVERQRAALRYAMASVAVALLVLGLKYAAYAVTGSVALYSDALESIVNVVAGLVALWAVKIANQPADSDHPFGHHKAEYFSAVVEGVLIVVAALLILNEAWGAFRHPEPLETPFLGMGINAVATAINLVWAQFLLGKASTLRSPALDADGRHIMADVVTSAGVLVGLALAVGTGWAILDPALATLVAVNILREGYKVVTKSLSGLLDQALDPADEGRVRAVISAHAQGALEVHDLKTRLAASAVFIEFHMVVPGAMSVVEAHRICDCIEAALDAEFDSVQVIIHVEPEEEAKQTGVPVL